jgi:hypothetical protein
MIVKAVNLHNRKQCLIPIAMQITPIVYSLYDNINTSITAC